MRCSAASADRRALVAFGVQPRLQQQSGNGHQHRHKQIHVRGEVQQAMPEGRQNAQRIQVGLGVVAQKLGVPEEESGLGVMPGIPARQRQNTA